MMMKLSFMEGIDPDIEQGTGVVFKNITTGEVLCCGVVAQILSSSPGDELDLAENAIVIRVQQS